MMDADLPETTSWFLHDRCLALWLRWRLSDCSSPLRFRGPSGDDGQGLDELGVKKEYGADVIDPDHYRDERADNAIGRVTRADHEPHQQPLPHQPDDRYQEAADQRRASDAHLQQTGRSSPAAERWWPPCRRIRPSTQSDSPPGSQFSTFARRLPRTILAMKSATNNSSTITSITNAESRSIFQFMMSYPSLVTAAVVFYRRIIRIPRKGI